MKKVHIRGHFVPMKHWVVMFLIYILSLALFLCALIPSDEAFNMTRNGMQLFPVLGLYEQAEKLTVFEKEKTLKCKVSDMCFPVHLDPLRSAYLSWLLGSEIENISLIYACCHDLCTAKMNIRWFYIFAKAVAQTGRFYLIIWKPRCWVMVQIALLNCFNYFGILKTWP